MIRKALESDRFQLQEFFKLIITDTFEKEGVGHLVEDIKNEIDNKYHYFEEHLKERITMFVYIIDGEIIGTGAIVPSSELITNFSPELTDTLEVGSVFIKPSKQRLGYGSELMDFIVRYLISCNINEFCLDSGYTIAKGIWEKKFGKPYHIVKNLWGEGHDHLIWKILTESYSYKKMNDLVDFRIK